MLDPDPATPNGTGPGQTLLTTPDQTPTDVIRDARQVEPEAVLTCLIVVNIGWHQPYATSRHMKASRDMRDDLPVIWLTANHQTRSARRARQWHWRDLFRKLASKRMQELRAKAEERGPHLGRCIAAFRPPDFDPEPMLDAVSALISEVNGLEQQSQSGAVQVEAAIRKWWARQQR